MVASAGVKVRGLRGPTAVFFGLAFLLSWAAWVPLVLSENGIGVWAYTFPGGAAGAQLLGVLPGAYLGPITAAAVVTAVADGRAGLREWLGRVMRWKVNWRWYALVLVGVPGVIVFTSIPLSDDHVVQPSAMVLAGYVPMLLMQFVTTGLAEEPGWRDFALPRLQRRFGPLGGTLVLGPLWGMWHLPLFLTDWGGPHGASALQVLEFVASAVTLSIVMTWVFNKTGESLPVVTLLHASVNGFFSLVWADMFPTLDLEDSTHVLLIASGVVAAGLLVATKGRLGYQVTGVPSRHGPGCSPDSAGRPSPAGRSDRWG